jgi:voltage-gated potassium channel Kch
VIRYLIPDAVLAESRRLLATAGREGLEAVVVWLGRELGGGEVEIVAVHMPEQIAIRTAAGVGVMLPDESVSRLIATLPAGLFVPIRLHTHPGAAYHSATDDENKLLSHRGAISIVVPDFATAEIDLGHCSVNELDREFRWRELGADEVAERFVVR